MNNRTPARAHSYDHAALSMCSICPTPVPKTLESVMVYVVHCCSTGNSVLSVEIVYRRLVQYAAELLLEATAVYVE